MLLMVSLGVGIGAYTYIDIHKRRSRGSDHVSRLVILHPQYSEAVSFAHRTEALARVFIQRMHARIHCRVTLKVIRCCFEQLTILPFEHVKFHGRPRPAGSSITECGPSK